MLAKAINELLLGNGFSPIKNSEKYKREHAQKISEAMESFDPEEISKAVSSNRKVDEVSTPRFEGKKFVYFAEKSSDHLPYKITCDFSHHSRKPSIQCEVLPFA